VAGLQVFRHGVRVLHWIDLGSGDVLGGAALGLSTPGPFVSVAQPYVGPVPIPATWSASQPVRHLEVPASEAWFCRLLLGHVPDLDRTKVALQALPERERQTPNVALRRVGLFAVEVDGALVTDRLEHVAGRSDVTFQTPWGPKVYRLARSILTVEYPPGFGGGKPVAIRCELLPDRRQRSQKSGPPLRVDAGDAPLGVELNARPEPSFASWEEVPLGWIAGIAYLPQGASPLPALRLELTRHP
jgi:hypothetical protein